MNPDTRLALALFILRLGSGFLVVRLHGFEKLRDFSDLANTFPDPLGISSTVTLTLVVFAEFVCGIAFMFGFLTRVAAAPLAMSMFIAAFFVHSSTPPTGRELSLLYLIPVLAVLLTGPGKFSIDAALAGGGGGGGGGGDDGGGDKS